MACRKREEARCVAGEVVSCDSDTLIENVEEIENYDINKPVKETQCEEINGKEKQFEKWFDCEVKQEEDERGEKVCFPGFCEAKTTN